MNEKKCSQQNQEDRYELQIQLPQYDLIILVPALLLTFS